MQPRHLLSAAVVAVLLGALVDRCSGGDSAEAAAKNVRRQRSAVSCDLVHRRISVDGDPADWQGIAPNVVRGAGHLWFGQGMTPENWHGDDDLSYQWRGAWADGRLFFLFQVNDDKLVQAGRPQSFLCDCVELYLDYNHSGGRRVVVLDGRDDWFARCDRREIKGFEMHFLPTQPVRVYLDHAHQYAVREPQTEEFAKDWSGEAVMKKTPTGYLIELGLRIPGVRIEPGKVIGLETGVCDDDGQGRKSIMTWTGTKKDFWITMEDYGTVRLLDSPTP